MIKPFFLNISANVCPKTVEVREGYNAKCKSLTRWFRCRKYRYVHGYFPLKYVLWFCLKSTEIERVLCDTCFYNSSRHWLPGFITFSAVRYQVLNSLTGCYFRCENNKLLWRHVLYCMQFFRFERHMFENQRKCNINSKFNDLICRRWNLYHS